MRALILRGLLGGLWVLAAAALCLADQDTLLGILESELARNFEGLKEKAEPPPYFMAYAVTDSQANVIGATLGTITANSANRSRVLDISVRIGDRRLDNYHSIRGQRGRFTSGARIALDNDESAIRRTLWLETDKTYRRASQRLIQIKTDSQVRVNEEDAPWDFSEEEPSQYSEKVAKLSFPDQEWTARLRRLSKEFSQYGGILSSNVNVVAQREVRYFVNTEGTRVEHGRLYARVSVSARAKAPDGMNLTSSESFEANDPSGLPDDARILGAIHQVAKELTEMSDAPVVEPYVGPAILSGRAAGVFFHEIFGHRVEGHRQKDAAEGQTFAKSIGTPVLPEFLSVIFDPTVKSHRGTDLMGWYRYDDEGVKARRVPLVEGGTMKTFLMSRSPVKGVSHSNGHGRRQPGREIVARQSNLIVESTKQVSEDRLREMLLEELKRQNKEFGFYFEHVTGGYTQTGRRGIQAFKVIPLVVWRVYADGRPDERVRGADIVGTPLASFAKIVATGDTAGIFNGYCGAESGSVPVSAISPALLVSELEVQKKESSQDRPPLLPRPFEKGGAE